MTLEIPQQSLSLTPLLDGERPLPAMSSHITGRQILWVVGGYGLLFVATVLIVIADLQPAVKAIQAFVRFVDRFIADLSSQPLASGLRLIARWYCVVAVHELGHVIAGFLAGFTFYWVSVGALARTPARCAIICAVGGLDLAATTQFFPVVFTNLPC